MPITAPEGYLDISNATLRGSEIITTSNVGIMNANPTMALSVGSNLHVNAYSSNVLEVNGNVVAEGLKLGFIEILPSYDLAAVSNVGNVTDSTIQFSNATTAFVTTSNIEVGTANLFVDTTTGKIGVGTTSPSTALEVYSSTGTQLKLSSSSRYSTIYGVDDTGSCFFGNDGGAFRITTGGDTSGTGASEALRVLSGGNVGIGLTTPTKMLHTKGEVVVGTSGDNFQNELGSLYFVRGATRGGTGFSDRHHYISTVTDGAAGGPAGNKMLFYIDDSTTTDGTSHVNSLTLTGSGNVGIGLDSPAFTLDVDGVSRSRGVVVNSGFGNDTARPAMSSGTTHPSYEIRSLGGNGNVGSTGADDGFLRLRAGGGTNAANASYIDLSGYSVYSGSDMRRNIVFGTFGTERMRINEDGNVGIGTATVYAKLQIQGSTGGISSGERSYFKYGNTTNFSYNSSAVWSGLSIYGNSNIGSGNFFVSHSGTIGASDTRIKKNIVDADDAECLEVLRLLKPKKYQYKDEIRRGTEPVWGFIAQEVRETLPYATQLRKDVLPNIYELANVSQSNVITFTNFNTSNLESNATTLIRTKGIDGEDHDVHLAEVIDEHTIRVEEDLTEWIGSVDETGNVVAGNQLFIYGQEVDDFIFVKKEAIWTVATSALQEVDRQLQAEKARNDALEARIAALENP